MGVDATVSPDASIDGSAKGLDRADEVAGIHGEQGRDNAREKQDRN